MVFFDALRVKVRDEGTVRNKAVYLALGVRADGRKEILGLWIEQTEGAKFWLRVMAELKNRGVEDILIAVVDGLKGFPDAIRGHSVGCHTDNAMGERAPNTAHAAHRARPRLSGRRRPAVTAARSQRKSPEKPMCSQVSGEV